jgi:hypothetical protein
LRRRKVELVLCGVRPDLARALRGTGLEEVVGPENLLPETAEPGGSTRDALKRAYTLLSTGVCPSCPRGVGGPPSGTAGAAWEGNGQRTTGNEPRDNA